MSPRDGEGLKRPRRLAAFPCARLPAPKTMSGTTSRSFRVSASRASGRQARLEETSLVALAVDFALVVLGGEVGGRREFRLVLQHRCRVRGGRDRITHLRERGREEGMMRVVRPRDPRKGLGGFGVFLGAIAGAPEVAPEALRMVGIEAHRLLDPV